MASIKQGLTKFKDNAQADELSRLLRAVLADNTALRAAIVGITAQLDADGGVTDTDYAATNNPAALTLTD